MIKRVLTCLLFLILMCGLSQLNQSFVVAEDDETNQNSGFVTIDGKTYYYDDNGQMIIGLNHIGEYYYYFNDDTGAMLVNEWKKIKGNYYYFDFDGIMQDGWIDYKGNKFYCEKSGKMVTGWYKIDGYWYYFKGGSSGRMLTGWIDYNGYKYYCDKDGKMLTGLQKIGNNWYFFRGGNSGRMMTGWRKSGDYWYYFKDNGKMQTGWIDYNGYKYYCDKDGKMLTGWNKIDGYWYYFRGGSSGRMLTGWIEYNKHYYYCDKTGKMLTGWQKIKGSWYYFRGGNSGRMLSGLQKIDGYWYYLGSAKSGKRTSGIQKVNGKYYYFDPERSDRMQFGNKEINGNVYYFNTSTGVFESVNSEAFVDGMKLNTIDLSKFTWTNGIPSYGKSKMGIDVSSHQGSIDWNKVKNDGVEFVILRVGFRGYGPSGLLRNDARFEEYYDGARSVGLPIGVYFFSQAINEAEAIEEANLMLNATQGKQIDLGYVYDLEDISYDSARTDNMSASQWTKNAVAFLNTIDKAGKKGILYTNMNWYRTKYYIDKLYKWDIWLAQYGTKNPSFPYEFNIWQFSENGRVDGISTKVDMNVKFN